MATTITRSQLDWIKKVLASKVDDEVKAINCVLLALEQMGDWAADCQLEAYVHLAQMPKELVVQDYSGEF